MDITWELVSRHSGSTSEVLNENRRFNRSLGDFHARWFVKQCPGGG